MTINELESNLGFELPPIFKRFITDNPNGYKPNFSLYITKDVSTSVESILSVEYLLIAWQNTLDAPFGWNDGESYLKDHKMLLIADLLGSDNFTVGFGEHNADVIYYLDWHEGPVPVCSSIYELLNILLKERPSNTFI